MARVTRTRARRSGGRNRRKLVWARLSESGIALAGGSPAPHVIDMCSDLEGVAGWSVAPMGATVMRIRGVISCIPDAYTVDGAVQFAAKIASGLEATGPSANEGPAVNSYDDWFLWEPFIFKTPQGGAGGVTDLQWQGHELVRTIDVRARRKLNEVGEVPLLYAQTVGTPAWHYSLRLSVLLALA